MAGCSVTLLLGQSSLLGVSIAAGFAVGRRTYAYAPAGDALYAMLRSQCPLVFRPCCNLVTGACHPSTGCGDWTVANMITMCDHDLPVSMIVTSV
jgi:hypothetical protein